MPDPFSPPLSESEVEAAIPDTRVLSSLGAGGQGTAFQVEYGPARSLSALKVYGPQTAVVRVEREIEKLEQLASQFVVRLYSHGTATIRGQSCQYAIMEFVEGTEVAGLVGTIPTVELDGELRRLLIDVASGIRDMWALRVVHRDIKPANLMRRASGGYVVLDLGLAKHLDQSTITQIGMTCGTWGYMSPEQAMARRGLTFRSDLFSLGLVAYEAATGNHPYWRRQDLVGRLSYAPLDSAAPSLSPEVVTIVNQLLELDPLKRPRRCDDIVTALSS